MNGAVDGLSAAIEWLETEIPRTPLGRICIEVQVLDGQILKVFKSVEEIILASQSGRSQNGASR